MWGSQQVFPTTVPGVTNAPAPTINNGLTFEQLATLVFMHSMLGNPHFSPHNVEELAQKAKEAARAVCLVL